MNQKEIDILERAFRKMEFSQSQINFAIAVIRNHIEPLEQQLAAAQAEVEQAFREGFRSPATYNDVLVNDEDEEWENYKRRK